MFNNVGGKISAISKFVFYCVSIILIISTILIMIANKAVVISNVRGIEYIERSSHTIVNHAVTTLNYGVMYSSYVIPFIVAGIILALYISTLFLVGFGELIENTSYLRRDDGEEPIEQPAQPEEENFYDDLDREERSKR